MYLNFDLLLIPKTLWISRNLLNMLNKYNYTLLVHSALLLLVKLSLVAVVGFGLRKILVMFGYRGDI